MHPAWRGQDIVLTHAHRRRLSVKTPAPGAFPVWLLPGVLRLWIAPMRLPTAFGRDDAP